MLGDGWYGSGLGWIPQRYCFGPPPDRLMAQVKIDFADGTSQTIATDDTWKMAESPILRSELYAGETYDARKEQPGWDRAGFKDSAWKPVVLIPGPELPITSAACPTIQVTQEVKPIKLTEVDKGVYVYDMGQNMVGWVRLRVSGKAGTAVRLRFAEILTPDGHIYRDNLRKAEATDTYTCKGGGEE